MRKLAVLLVVASGAPRPAEALSAKVSASRGIPWSAGSAPRSLSLSRVPLSSTHQLAPSLPVPFAAPALQPVPGLTAAGSGRAGTRPAPSVLASLSALAASAGESARFLIDGGRLRPEGEPIGEPESTKAFLDARLAEAGEALKGPPRVREALQALEVLEWSREYLLADEYDGWMREHAGLVAALDRRLAKGFAAEIGAALAEDDTGRAREILEELEQRHPLWAQRHAEELERLREELPDEYGRVIHTPTPATETERVVEMLRGHLEMGEWRQVLYFIEILEKKHPRWVREHAEQLEAAREAYRQAVFKAFEAKKARFSPVEARRLQEYAMALADGRNRGFGFAQPLKQDPESLLCTVLSICNALQASIGFADPAMDAVKFTELVRRLLKDPEIGVKRGISTHRMRVLMSELGLPLKVISMQERLKRPFEEEELLRLMRPDRVVLPVFTIAQQYADETGLRIEEHKGFLRDAFWSPTEKEWVYLMMDPLIGRTSFYTWSEMKVFLHKLFVIKVDKPLAAPKD